MKRESNTLTVQPQFSWKQAVLNASFFVFSALLLFISVSGFAHVSVNEPPAGIHFTDHPKSDFTFSDHQTTTHPLGTGFVFIETEVVDETKTGSEFDDDLSSFHVAIPALSLHSNNSLFLQLKQANEGREKISLFVLHHSWRSFLS